MTDNSVMRRTNDHPSSECLRPPRAVSLAAFLYAAVVAGFGQTCFAADSVSIELTGEVVAACGLSGASVIAVDLGQITNQGSREIPLMIDCNAPFLYSIESKFGGLRNADLTNPLPRFADLIPYLLMVTIPTDAGVLSGQCESNSLLTQTQGCSYPSSSWGIAIRQTGSLTFSWSIPEELLAGTYADVVTIRFQPRY